MYWCNIFWSNESISFQTVPLIIQIWFKQCCRGNTQVGFKFTSLNNNIFGKMKVKNHEAKFKTIFKGKKTMKKKGNPNSRLKSGYNSIIGKNIHFQWFLIDISSYDYWSLTFLPGNKAKKDIHVNGQTVKSKVDLIQDLTLLFFLRSILIHIGQLLST
uniref:Uncharacterized protein n=1 Tax=Tetranychus urticae TaxID=32264 RepID=T1K0G7_TETUR